MPASARDAAQRLTSCLIVLQLIEVFLGEDITDVFLGKVGPFLVGMSLSSTATTSGR